MAAPHLPEQYDAEVYTGSLASIPSTFVALHDGTKMYSLKELAANLAVMFKAWIDFTQDITSVDATSSIAKGIDLLPCRMQLIKSTTHHLPTDSALLLNPQAAHEVEYDDIEFGDSKVDVSAYTSVKLHNVTPASGNVLLSSDPMGSDNITHVPLKGKMYVFSGPTPKVWDKHRSDLQHLFKPEFFRGGRYLLPNSKLHSTQTEEFRTPPRGRFIWSNCVDEHKITMAPGGMQELKLNYRVKTSIRDFWYKYRDDDLSSSKLGQSICVCLEPSMRRMHVNTPIPVVLVKEQHVPVGGVSPFYSTATRLIPVEYQPYEWRRDATTGVTTKQIRDVTTLGSVNTQVPVKDNYPLTTGATLVPDQYAHPGIVNTISWFVTSDDLVAVPDGGLTGAALVAANLVLALPGIKPLKWDKVTTSMIAQWPQLQSFVSRGDPLMFNVQINRNYGASCALRNSVRLGADKSGVKRKYHEKMVSNMGDVNSDGLVNAQDLIDAKAAGDIFADHELETATGAGVRTLIQEGDAQNTVLPTATATVTVTAPDVYVAAPSVTVTGLPAGFASTVSNALASAMDTDGNAANGVQLDISQLDAVLNSGGTALQMEETGTAHLNALLAANALSTAANTIHTDANTLATDANVLSAASAVAIIANTGATIASGAATVSALGGVTTAATALTAEASAMNTQFATAIPLLTTANTQVGVTNTRLAALATNTAANAVSVGLNTTAVSAMAGIIAGKSFAPTTNNITNNNDYDNTTTSTITVGATANQIADAMIAGGTSGTAGIPVHFPTTANLSVTESAPVTSMAISGTVATSGHPTHVTIAHAVDAQGVPIPLHVTETAPVTSMAISGTVATSGHPTHLTVGNAVDSNGDAIPLDTSGHPTSVSVSNHPTPPTSVSITGTVPVSIAGTVATSGGGSAATASSYATITHIAANGTSYGILVDDNTTTTVNVYSVASGSTVLQSGAQLLGHRVFSGGYSGGSSGGTWILVTDIVSGAGGTLDVESTAADRNGVVSWVDRISNTNQFSWTITTDNGVQHHNQAIRQNGLTQYPTSSTYGSNVSRRVSKSSSSPTDHMWSIITASY